jgi:hypothetical protein
MCTLFYTPAGDSSDTYNTDGCDSERGRSRPVSRISLNIPYDDTHDDSDSHFHLGSVTVKQPSDMSFDGCSTCYETDFMSEYERESYPIKKSPKKQKAYYGHISGEEMDCSPEVFTTFHYTSIH